MTTKQANKIERDWARLGVLFGCKPSGATPDLERLLIRTARHCPGNARLFPTVVTWLSKYSEYIARHRLKHLAATELTQSEKAVLGLIIEEALGHGATKDLQIVAEICLPRVEAGPLSDAQRESPVLAQIAEKHASEASRKWGVWVPPVTLKTDAIRPVEWLLEHNPSYLSRITRKGDLRVSILVSLRQDFPSQTAPSEIALARSSGATRIAVRKALRSLQLEGQVVVGPVPGNRRGHAVTLLDAA